MVKSEVADTVHRMCFTLAVRYMFLELADKGERTWLAELGLSKVIKA